MTQHNVTTITMPMPCGPITQVGELRADNQSLTPPYFYGLISSPAIGRSDKHTRFMSSSHVALA